MVNSDPQEMTLSWAIPAIYFLKKYGTIIVFYQHIYHQNSTGLT